MKIRITETITYEVEAPAQFDTPEKLEKWLDGDEAEAWWTNLTPDQQTTVTENCECIDRWIEAVEPEPTA